MQCVCYVVVAQVVGSKCASVSVLVLCFFCVEVSVVHTLRAGRGFGDGVVVVVVVGGGGYTILCMAIVV